MLKTFERIEEQFNARVVENEIEVDLFRVPVPNYDRRAFREALINALVHRDYTRLGAIHVQRTEGGIMISNPGGFVEGVTLDNLLVVAPRPRSPLLADAIKRIGLAEPTGRGIDLIYQGPVEWGQKGADVHLEFQDLPAHRRNGRLRSPSWVRSDSAGADGVT